MRKDNYYTETVYDGKWKRYTYNAGDWYEEVSNPDEWMDCPKCGKKPLIWVFDNGRVTACGCGENMYNAFRITAESIMSVYNRDGSTQNYNTDELRLNWNKYCEINLK